VGCLNNAAPAASAESADGMMTELETAVASATGPAAFRAGSDTGAKPVLGLAALALPLLVLIAFIGGYSRPMPVTDEWFFLRAVAALEQVPWSNISRIAQLLPYRIYYHEVIVPFVLYWPVAELSNFDNRALLVITLAAWVIVLLLFRYSVIRSTWWTLPVAVILFSPGRYMEFLWGWQFTQVLSVLFPVLGLAVLGSIAPEEGIKRELQKFAAAIGLILLGTLSSAGGFFGFIGGIVMLSVQPLPRGHRVFLLELLIAVMLAVYFLLMRDSGQVPSINLRNIFFVLTALGSAILGMPEAFREFGLNLRSAVGAAVILLTAAAFVLAARRRILPALSLPAGIFTCSICSVAAIAVARDYLGNWHLEYAVPAVCACYASCYIVFRELRSVAAAQLCLSAAILMMLSIVGYYSGFGSYGPEYSGYVRSIEQYARGFLANPGQPKPFPLTGGWDLNANMVWFLAAKHHAVFAGEDRALLAAPRIAAKNAKAVVLPNGAGQANPANVLVVASLPANQQADALILQTGETDVILRKTDPRLLPSSACAGLCFTALAAASGLPPDIPANLSAVNPAITRNASRTAGATAN